LGKQRIGIDSYSLYPLQLSPLEILKWAKETGAEGVLFSGLSPEGKKDVDTSYLKDISQYAASNNMYLEWGGKAAHPLGYDYLEEKRKKTFKNWDNLPIWETSKQNRITAVHIRP